MRGKDKHCSRQEVRGKERQALLKTSGKREGRKNQMSLTRNRKKDWADCQAACTIEVDDDRTHANYDSYLSLYSLYRRDEYGYYYSFLGSAGEQFCLSDQVLS